MYYKNVRPRKSRARRGHNLTGRTATKKNEDFINALGHLQNIQNQMAAVNIRTMDQIQQNMQTELENIKKREIESIDKNKEQQFIEITTEYKEGSKKHKKVERTTSEQIKKKIEKDIEETRQKLLQQTQQIQQKEIEIAIANQKAIDAKEKDEKEIQKLKQHISNLEEERKIEVEKLDEMQKQIKFSQETIQKQNRELDENRATNMILQIEAQQYINLIENSKKQQKIANEIKEIQIETKKKLQKKIPKLDIFQPSSVQNLQQEIQKSLEEDKPVSLDFMNYLQNALIAKKHDVKTFENEQEIAKHIEKYKKEHKNKELSTIPMTKDEFKFYNENAEKLKQKILEFNETIDVQKQIKQELQKTPQIEEHKQEGDGITQIPGNDMQYGMGNGDSLTNVNIEKIVQQIGIPYWQGVFDWNLEEIKKIVLKNKKCSFIVNTAKITDSDKKMHHWTAFYFNMPDFEIYYYDSLDLQYLKEKVILFVNDIVNTLQPDLMINFYYNKYADQQKGSKKCGLFAVRFLDLLLNQYDKHGAYSMSVDLEQNDKIVQKNYHKYLI